MTDEVVKQSWIISPNHIASGFCLISIIDFNQVLAANRIGIKAECENLFQKTNINLLPIPTQKTKLHAKLLGWVDRVITKSIDRAFKPHAYNFVSKKGIASIALWMALRSHTAQSGQNSTAKSSKRQYEMWSFKMMLWEANSDSPLAMAYYTAPKNMLDDFNSNYVDVETIFSVQDLRENAIQNAIYRIKLDGRV